MGRSGPFGMVIVLPQYFTSPVQPLMPLLSERECLVLYIVCMLLTRRNKMMKLKKKLLL